jgi:undecaprenyl-diphosphatase
MTLIILLKTVIMGLVEGITEFLPVSSTGHLILSGDLLGFDAIIGGKELADAFEIIIQLGAILAVVAAYPGRFASLMRLGDNRGLSGLRGLTLLAITTIPASIVGLLLHHRIEHYLFGPKPVAAALAVGAIGILAVEWLRPGIKMEGLDRLTWKESLWVGLFQCFSLWPGMSRSACTILGGMIVGVDRKTATEYSFLAAVPVMLLATGYKLYKTCHLLAAAQILLFVIGFVVAFFSAWAAVKVFIHFLSRHTLVPFGWYRLAVAAIVAVLILRGVIR